jgi:hypothetical protein
MVLSLAVIQYPSFECGRSLNRTDDVFSPLEFFRPTHDNIFWNVNIVHRRPDFELFGPFGTLHGHDYKQIHITVGCAVSSGVRTEQDDLFRMKLRHDTFDHLLDMFIDRVLSSDHDIYSYRNRADSFISMIHVASLFA